MIDLTGYPVAYAMVALWMLGMALGFVFGWDVCARVWRREMINRGHAQYHFKDGKWYWNEKLPKPSAPEWRADKILERTK